MSSKIMRGGLLVLLSMSIASEVLWQLYVYCKKLRTDQNNREASENARTRIHDARITSDLWNTALFFPDKINSGSDSLPFQLYAYLESAITSVKICVFIASLPAFERIILQKWREGLAIHIITDHGTMAAHTNINCLNLQQAGIPLRTNNIGNGHFMHNNFVIIDDDALLTGSLNFTAEGLLINNADLLVTTQTGIVAKYKDEFDLLWREGKDTDFV